MNLRGMMAENILLEFTNKYLDPVLINARQSERF